MTDTQIIRLKRDNFTPLPRTPWAGKLIGATIKNIDVGRSPEFEKIGESWEFSLGPEFPSIDSVSGRSVDKVMHVGDQAYTLIKYLNADYPLSLQIHPSDSYDGLLSDESGKPEAWYVIDHEPGAGIYLGFKQNLNMKKLRDLLLTESDLQPYMNFIPVEKDDYFEIHPGLPHSLAPGALILEPQSVLPGKKGVTYRLWDWNKTYFGKKRQLHIDDGLNIIDQELAFSPEKIIERVKKPAKKLLQTPDISLRTYTSSFKFKVFILELKKETKIRVDFKGRYFNFLTISGMLSLMDKKSLNEETIANKETIAACAGDSIVVYPERSKEFSGFISAGGEEPSLAAIVTDQSNEIYFDDSI